MADLRPIPLATLLRRAYHEYARGRAIFDLPARSFSRSPDFSAFRPSAARTRSQRGSVTDPDPGSRVPPLDRARGGPERATRVEGPGPDLSVPYAGTRAPNPIGPAAGPHTQLAQNLVLSWLAGAGVIELKTIQIREDLTLSRPCIDMKTVGYNTEWSQELRLEESLREYVKGSMVVDMLGPGTWDRGPVVEVPSAIPVLDISVGYDLAGVTSGPVVRWLERMQDASSIVDELRAEIPDEFGALADLPFRTALSSSVTLSTFHGAPAAEIERIGEFLIGELGLHTVIKLNPPMLGRERVEHILHDVLGYDDIEVNPELYARELRFEEGVDLVRRLQSLATRRGVTVGVKCGNTLEVRNRGTYLREPVQYLSGQPLHALHAALALDWREAFGPDLQISFSGGVDANNAADCVAAGLVPVTTCTDLLRPGGYARLPKYLQSLESGMKQLGARTIEEFIVKSAALSGGGRDAVSPSRGSETPVAPTGSAESGVADPGFGDAILRNTQRLLERALTDDRYRAGRNRKPPRKLGTHLWLWDCLSCRKCIPVCPNDAIFEVETESFVGEVPVIAITPHGWQERERRLYRALKTTQIVIFADACNDCGNCDVFCPEDGGPHIEKPRFFGSLAAYHDAAPLTGFVLESPSDASGVLRLRGRFAVGEYTLEHRPGSTTTCFVTPDARLTVDWASHDVQKAELAPGPRAPIPNCVSLAPYLTLRLLLGALLTANRVNFVNANVVSPPPAQESPSPQSLSAPM